MKKIRSASLDLTYECNFRCLHCFNSSGEHNNTRKLLTDEECVKIALELASYEPDSICLCGGETMLRRDLIYKISQAINNSPFHKVSLCTVSNGYLINEEIADKLSQCGLEIIQISLDGATADSHDWLRNKKGSFEHAINAIKLLIHRNIKVAVAFTPTKKNINELEKAIDMAHDLGVRFFRLQPTMSLGRARNNLTQYLLDYEEYLQMKFLIDKKRMQYYAAGNFTIEWGDPIDHLKYGIHSDNILYALAINAYGDIMISPYLPLVFGNIREESLENYFKAGITGVWGNPIVKKIVDNIHSVEDMDVSRYGLPEIYLDENINLDILDPEYNEKTKRILESMR